MSCCVVYTVQHGNGLKVNFTLISNMKFKKNTPENWHVWCLLDDDGMCSQIIWQIRTFGELLHFKMQVIALFGSNKQSCLVVCSLKEITVDLTQVRGHYWGQT